MNNLNFKWSLSPDDKYYKLRSGEYAYHLKVNIPEKDKFDPVSEHLIVFSNNEIVGGARLTISTKIGIPLESETCLLSGVFSKKHLLEFGYGEVTRLFLKKEFRNIKTVTSIYSLMNAKRTEYGTHYLFSFQPKSQARLTAIVCKKLGYCTRIIETKDLCKDSIYNKLGKIYLIAIINKEDLKWINYKTSKNIDLNPKI